jgi:quercetin dioxygenase-like cupin family protein
MAKSLFDPSSVGHVNLLTAVPIVAGSIVSKPVLHTASCKVVVFAMDAGQAISEHQAPYVLTVHVLDGKLGFRVADEQYTLVANDWLLVPYDRKHDLTAIEPTRFVLTMLEHRRAASAPA